MLIETNGPIKQIKLSEKWFGDPLETGILRHTVWCFYHVLDQRAMLFIFSPGNRYGKETGKIQKENVFKPGLCLEGSEWPDIFRMMPAVPFAGKTRDDLLESGVLNGRSAIFTHRQWDDQSKAIHIQTDALDDGTFLCEFSYKAPPEIFDSYLEDAQEVFRSVVWRDPVELEDWPGGRMGMYIDGVRVYEKSPDAKPITSEQWKAREFNLHGN